MILFNYWHIRSSNSLSLISISLIIVISTFSVCEGKTYIEDLTLSSNEKAQLDKFKERVAHQLPHDYMRQDFYLIRWLRVQDYNLDRAERMLMNNIRWREKQNMDTIHEEDWTDMSSNYPYSLESRAKEGKPVLYINVGTWDLRQAAISGKSERFLRYIDKVIDEAVILVQKLADTQQNVSQAILLLNLKGFNLVEHGCLQCIPLILRIIFSYENHTPGYADKIILVNTPAIAEPVILVARGALHPETSRNLFAYGTNPNVWAKALSRDFTFDELPPELGGTKHYTDLPDDY